MKYPNKDYIEHLRRKYPPGTRLQLSCMEDEMAVPPGSMGTVLIDDAGQIRRLGLRTQSCGTRSADCPNPPKIKAGDAR